MKIQKLIALLQAHTRKNKNTKEEDKLTVQLTSTPIIREELSTI
jgi:hypothetical protein